MTVTTYIVLLLLGVAEDVVGMFLQQEGLGVLVCDLHVLWVSPLEEG